MKQNQSEFTNLPITRIEIQEGFNPRKFFDNAEFQQLVASVKTEGVIQPIIVRPKTEGDDYWLVAGERRWRAAKEANLAEIPAVVRSLNDKEARLIATLENTQRADMSPAEEAVAARDVLTDCGGDKTEALRLLGWSVVKFDARLLLLHAAPEVLNALTGRKIKLGHAELLSQLPNDFQTATLAKILENGYSVADLKSRLASFSLDLSKATFDKSGCNGCPHNSSMQSSLFEEHISEGMCANRACYEQKAQAAMVEKKNSLSEKYAVVFLDTERRPDSYKIICQSGAEGVGKSQFEQGCRQCAHFGALLSTSPDRLGRITEDCCFNLDCHKEKVAAYQASAKSASASPTDKGEKTKSSDSKKPSNQTAQPATNTKTEAGQASKDSGDNSSSASAATPPPRVIEKIWEFYRDLSAKQIGTNQLAALYVNIFALYRLVSPVPDEKMPDSLKKTKQVYFELADFIKVLSSSSLEEVAWFNQQLLFHFLSEHEKTSPAMNKAWAKGAASVLNVIQPKLTDHFILDREFLGSFTKAGIEGVLREAVNGAGLSFVEHYEKKSEKHKFVALMKKKNNEILDEVFGGDYDFSGFVPSCVYQVMGDNFHQDMGIGNDIDPEKAEALSLPKNETPICPNCMGFGWEPSVNEGRKTCQFCQSEPSPTNNESEIVDLLASKSGSFDGSAPEEMPTPSSYLDDSDWFDDDEAMSLNASGYTQDPNEEI